MPTDTYRELFERSADAILILDGDRFVDCNQATVEMLRYRDKAELLRTHPSELSPPRQSFFIVALQRRPRSHLPGRAPG